MGIIRNDPPPCPSCHTLGDFEHEGVRYQLYFCLLRLHSLPIVDPDWPTIMVRFGDGPSEFRSGWSVEGSDPALAEAERRAAEAGLRDPKKPLHPGMQRAVEALADLIVTDMLRWR